MGWIQKSELTPKTRIMPSDYLSSNPDGSPVGGGGEYTVYLYGDREMSLGSHCVWHSPTERAFAVPVAWDSESKKMVMEDEKTGELMVVGLVGQDGIKKEGLNQGQFAVLDEPVPEQFQKQTA